MQRIGPSVDGHHLVDEDGRPFFLLADTAWEICHKSKHADADFYLEDRAAKGFTAIMALLLAEFDLITHPNAFGDLPLKDMDLARPNEPYFEYVDYVVRKTQSLGMVFMVCPAWARGYLPDRNAKERSGRNRYGVPMIFDAENARSYCEFIGDRYKDHSMIWVLGGDRSPVGYEDIWEAMVQGIKAGDDGRNPVTFHSARDGGTRKGSSPHFHDKEWLDLNMFYSGHQWSYPAYEGIARDYALSPPKPTFDGEPKYENHPLIGAEGYNYHVNPKLWDGVTRANAHQIRQATYWAMLAGAAGHTYGCNDTWQLYDGGRKSRIYANTPWQKALHFPGAYQMGYMRELFESRPWQALIPDQTLIVAGQGQGEDHVQAACAEDGSFLFAYLPLGTPIAVDMTRISGPEVIAHWFDPRTGAWTRIGAFSNTGRHQFAPPERGGMWDWILVLDDAAKAYPVIDHPRDGMAPIDKVLGAGEV